MRQAALCASILALSLGGAMADESKSSFQKVEDQRERTSTTVTGTVVSTSGHILAIETQAGNRMDFEIGADSVVPAGMGTGSRVSVRYKPGESGVSQVVRLSRLGAAPPESAAKLPTDPESVATPSASTEQKAAAPSVGVVERSLPSQPARHKKSQRKTVRSVLRNQA